jgi:hypothetical protein
MARFPFAVLLLAVWCSTAAPDSLAELAAAVRNADVSGPTRATHSKLSALL